MIPLESPLIIVVPSMKLNDLTGYEWPENVTTSNQWLFESHTFTVVSSEAVAT